MLSAFRNLFTASYINIFRRTRLSHTGYDLWGGGNRTASEKFYLGLRAEIIGQLTLSRWYHRLEEKAANGE